MKKIMSMIIGATMVLSMTACGNSGSTTNPNENGETIKIGALAPLTGGASVYGIATSNGVKMGIAEINANGGVLGKQIELILLDEKGDAVEAVNAYNKLIDEGVVAVIGDVTSAPAEAIAQVAVEDNMPMITPTGTATSITKERPNVFRACFMDPFQGKIMATFATDTLKVKKVAVIYDNGSDYSQGLASAFDTQAKANGLEVVAYESYVEADVDFSTLLDKVIATNPEVIFVPDYYSKVALIVDQARSAGFTGAMLGGDGWDGVLDVLPADKQSVVNNTYFSNHYSKTDTDKKVVDFLANYKTTYDMEANAFAALGYDAAYMMADAIEKAGGTESQGIIDALAAISIDGVTGHITFDEQGDPIKSVAITKFVDGKAELAEKITA